MLDVTAPSLASQLLQIGARQEDWDCPTVGFHTIDHSIVYSSSVGSHAAGTVIVQKNPAKVRMPTL